MNPKEADELLEGGPFEEVNQELSANPSNHVDSTDYGARVELGPGSEVYETARTVYKEFDREASNSPNRNEVIFDSGKLTGIMVGAALERVGEHIGENYQDEVFKTTYNGEKVDRRHVEGENPFIQDFDPKFPALHAKFLAQDLERTAEDKDPISMENLGEDDLIGDSDFSSGMRAGLDSYLSSDDT